MLYWLLVIPVLGILILAHELGHFYAARWMKVRVEEFGFGYPPRLVTLGQRNGVLYTLNWIPAGGFVRLAGEEDPAVEGGLAEKKPWQRAVVLSAGSLMNLLLCFLLFTGLALAPRDVVTLERIGLIGIIPGSPAAGAGLQTGDILLAVDDIAVRDQTVILELTLRGGQPTVLTIEREGQTFTVTVVPSVEAIHGLDHLGVTRYLHEYPDAELKQVVPGRPAYEAGLRPGDVVVELNGEVLKNNLHFWDLQHRLRQEGIPLHFVVRRNGDLLEFTVYPPPPDAEDSTIGIGWWAPTERVRLSPPAALLQGAKETIETVLLVPRLLAAMFRGSVSVKELSGPIGIAHTTAEVAQANRGAGVLRLIGMLSANLFVVNLLPLPALDGGRLVFVFLEWVRRGRRIPRRWEAWVHAVGMALLLAFLVLVSYFDILRLASP